MPKKFNNKTLAIVLAVLLTIFLLTKLLNMGKNERNFKTDLVSIDTAQVTSILLYPKEDKTEIKLIKSNGHWQAQQGKVTAKADLQAVNGLLSTLQTLEPQRLASRSKEKWDTFEVTDSLGTHIKVMNDKQVMADFYVGKFSIQQMASQQNMPPRQQQPKATSYVRLAGEEEVYAVDGFLTATFNRQFNSWRDKTLLKLNKNDITSISFSYPADSGFTVTKKDSIWMADNVRADSTEIANYLSRIANLSSNSFIDDFSAEGKEPAFEAIIEGKNMDDVAMEGYQNGKMFVLRTSRHPDVFISSDSTGLFSQVFVGKEKLLKED